MLRLNTKTTTYNNRTTVCLFLFFILQFTIRNLLINYTVYPLVWGFGMPWSHVANPISPQEDGSRCCQVTWGRAAKQPLPNPSVLRVGKQPKAGSYLAAGIIPPHNSLKMEIYTGYHFKDERLFYRLANVTNIHGGKNNFQGRRSARLCFCREWLHRPALFQSLTS